jgi:iron-sulfur cluster repair protein YtfE (RIC family)
LPEIESEGRKGGEVSRWEDKPLSELIAWIVNYYHRRLREELPLLVAMAARVEQVHGKSLLAHAVWPATSSSCTSQ